MSASSGTVIKYGLRRPLSAYKLLRSLYHRPCKLFIHPSLPSNSALERITSCNTSYNSFSTKASSNDQTDVTFEELQKAQKDSRILIIDVREQDEVKETGKLPGSIHIPMADVAKELTSLSRPEFKNKYDKDKPAIGTEIILSCRSGKRSLTVQQELLKMGYNNARNYSGGWMEWERNTKNQ